MNDKVYFDLYEDRYRRLCEQGIEDWIYNPEELASTIKHIDDFLKYTHCKPSKTSIIEFGCGQGHMAKYLLGHGYRYLGIDISETAIQQAIKKTGTKGKNAFILADITELSQIPDNSYDVAIDNQCFHMLITDKHREKYLAEVKRILKNGVKVYFQENSQLDEFKENITSLQQFNKAFSDDQKAPTSYTAYVRGKQRKVELPRLPARANNEEGYRKELKAAGFTVEYFSKERNQCMIYTSLL